MLEEIYKSKLKQQAKALVKKSVSNVSKKLLTKNSMISIKALLKIVNTESELNATFLGKRNIEHFCFLEENNKKLSKNVEKTSKLQWFIVSLNEKDHQQYKL